MFKRTLFYILLKKKSYILVCRINLSELIDFSHILINIGDVLCGNEFNGTTHLGILQQWFGIHWWTCRTFALLIVALFIMLPLLMLRRVGTNN